MKPGGYRGRIAPSPTGYLHVGHASTFWIACERARAAGGVLAFRNEDLDPQRSRPEYRDAMFEDLRWLGITWQEGPDVGGPYGPYVQSQRRDHYLRAWKQLLEGGWIFPCTCSRKDLAEAAQAPHEMQSDDEPLYNGRCRERHADVAAPAGVNWRFRVPDGRTIWFLDNHYGECQYTAGTDIGDFLIWRRDDVPAYQLAVVADDAAMEITEVVRGADLLKSTARQLLLYEALGKAPPEFYHCDLVKDSAGVRLAKRHDALSLRRLRSIGKQPEDVRQLWNA